MKCTRERRNSLCLPKSLRLCLVPEKYKGKKKNVKENDFFMFDCPIKYFKEN